MTKKMIVANWKMNGDLSLIKAYADLFKDLSLTNDVVVCPPFVYLWSAIGAGYLVGAQDCHYSKMGAHTGSISPLMLKNIGVQYVILGHSERRQNLGETDITIQKKAKTAIECGLKPIICIGETLEEKEDEKTLQVLKDQMQFSIPRGIEDIIIAYEPIWAIGSGKTATPNDIKTVHQFIRELLPNAKILYGGSVKADNANIILNLENVDGLLVGGASLDIDAFESIIKS